MTALDVAFYGEPDRRGFVRWTASLLIVLALHAAVIATLLTKREPVEVADRSPPAVLIDMAPPEPAPQPAASDAAAPPVVPAPPPPIEEPAPPPKPQLRTDVEPAPIPSVTEITNAPVPKPPPPKPRAEPSRREPPRPAEAQRQARPEPRPQAEAPRGLLLKLQPSVAPTTGLSSAPPPLSRDVPYEPGSSDRTNAVESFQRRLIAHLARYKRYPQISRIRREQGIVRVRFTMDRNGTVLSSDIVRSSGYSALDAEVEALLHRAQPLPPLPPESGLNRFQIEMPVQFYLWQRE